MGDLLEIRIIRLIRNCYITAMSLRHTFYNLFTGHRDTILVLDIGGSSVKAAVVKILEAGRCEIAGFHQEFFDEEIVRPDTMDAKKLKVVASRARFLAERMAKVTTREVIIGLADEFVGSATLSLRQKRDDPQAKISANELKNMLTKMKWQLGEKIKARGDRGSISIIHAPLQEVLIDGWRVTHPVGFTGKEISLNIYYSYITESNFKLFNELAHGMKLGVRDMVSRSYALVRYELGEHGPDFSALFVNVSTYRTDLILVDRGKIVEGKSVGVGSYAFTNRIAASLGISFLEAEQIKLKYAHGDLSKSISERIHEILEKDVAVWQNGLVIAVRDCTSTALLPEQFFVYGGGANLPDIEPMINKVDWLEEASFNKNPVTHILNTEDIEIVTDSTRMIERGCKYVALMGLIAWVCQGEARKKEMAVEVASGVPSRL